MQAVLNIAPTEDTPRIHFDGAGELRLSHRSLPEDAVEFYLPIMTWLEQYLQSPTQLTTLIIKLEYYNTTSAKQLFKILTLLESAEKENAVIVKWYYVVGDEDMRFAGERFARLLELPFEIIEIEDY